MSSFFAYLFFSFSASVSVMAIPIFLKAAVISFVQSFPVEMKQFDDFNRIKDEVAWLAVLILVDGGEDEAELSLVLSEVVEELLSVEISAFVGIGLVEKLLK